MGIPDLRGPGVIGLEVDEIIVEQMLANYDRATYAELLDLRLHGAPTFGDLIGHETAYHLDQAERGREMVSMFQIRLAEFFGTSAQALALDIGCGSGASLVALAESYQHVAGIDPSLPDLILAQKALEARKVANVQLVQAYGQRLPFPDQAFDYVNALNVLEHVFDFDSVLCEIYRVLKPGGGFAADSRNRFDLLLPEPHVKIRWVGWLPRRWAKTYVRWRRGVGYEATQLLSLADLRRGLDRRFGSGYRIVFPHVSAYGGPAWVESWLARLEHMPIMRDLVLWIFPSHLVLAKR
ncbi:MAG: methyltransferase domain-containing protein [Anaerolineales bacterium]